MNKSSGTGGHSGEGIVRLEANEDEEEDEDISDETTSANDVVEEDEEDEESVGTAKGMTVL